MKKIIILLVISLLIFTGCYRVETPTEQPFFVHLYKHYCAGCPVEPINWTAETRYYLFKDVGKEIDKEKSYSSVYKDGVIFYTDGSKDNYRYEASPFSDSGAEYTVYTPVGGGSFSWFPDPNELTSYRFKSIPNGNYILFVVFSLDGYNVDGASHKRITVDYDYRLKIEKKTFLFKRQDSGEYKYGYQDWDEKW